jgi:hypothetical protein
MRNTHYVGLSIRPKKEGEEPVTVHVARHLIEAVVDHKDGATVLMNSGVAYEVTEKSKSILERLKSVGVGAMV